MNKFVENNATWLSLYDDKAERSEIQKLIHTLQIDSQKTHSILDIGCGNGRSVTWIKSLFPQSEIIAIDISQDNINYAKKHCSYAHVSYVCIDAFKYCNSLEDKLFDIVFFSWSLFDMVSAYNQSMKEEKLIKLLNLVKGNLSCDGYVIITQPTKGGDFEKLLTIFMPGSDDDYLLTHRVLDKMHFHGPNSPFPSCPATNAIWSYFICNETQLYNGIEAILMLETGQQLDNKTFHDTINRFCAEYQVKKNGIYKLSDCVGLYYLKNGEQI